jgi:hypothetical protein
MFNLFALEGYHIVDALHVPAIATHPYLIPYRCPVNFSALLTRQHPELSCLLRRGEVAQLGKEASSDVVGMLEVG